MKIGKTYQIDHQDGDYHSYVGRGTILSRDGNYYLVSTGNGILRLHKSSIKKEVKSK